MKKKYIISFLVLVLLLLMVFFFGWGFEDEEYYRFVTVEKGNVERTVASTGQLSAVTTVQVGTQVSGIISAINVDFNDQVEKGQVVAKIDTTLLDIAVRDAQAKLEQSQAQYNQAKLAFERNKRLFRQKIVTDNEYEQSKYNFESSQAGVRSAEVSVDRAKQNLSYATITAPVSGTVIERNVDVGQTVAASFSAPQLFLIANDLAQMQILVTVDESDIGLIRKGMQARFTVQAFPRDLFYGVVRQVRLQSRIEENVVTYTAVVDVENKDMKLLPGMTASVDFLVAKAEDVLKVANTAIRFRPSEAMKKKYRQQGGEPIKAGRSEAVLWLLDDRDQLAPIRVKTGITDNQMTVIEEGEIQEGMQAISGILAVKPSDAKNPFQNNQRRRRGF